MSSARPNAMSIFGRLLEIDTPADRDAFLTKECGDDRALRAEVDSLLQAFARAGSFVRRDEPQGTTQHNEVPTEGPGTIVGSYKLLEKIGEGGMGIVYMAEQFEPVKRRVALKVIKAGMDSAEVVARFEAERQALALMDHPNIARVFDGGMTRVKGQTSDPAAQTSDLCRWTAGRPYFVMELVKGIPITRFCDERKLSLRERLELFIPVCQAVQHAHQRGIIHRDMKPSNVLIAMYDGKPAPKIIDFGVAKAIGQQLTEKTLFTGFGGIVGTLEYMSPEQAEFNQLDIDTRTDVYALGVLLYELLTGSTPLNRQRLKDAALAEVLRIIKEEEPPKPSTRLSTAKREALSAISEQRRIEPDKLTKLVRGDLDVIVMKALEKDRNRRYASAHELALDIQHYLADEPVAASPPSVGYRVRKLMKRNKGAVAAALALVAMLLLGMAGTSIGLVGALFSKRDAIRAANAEAKERQHADDQRILAQEAEAKAIAARENEIRQLYAADMLLASRAVTDGPLSRAIDLLDAWRPARREGKDYRGREWHMLRRLCDTSEKTLVGHTGQLRALAWSKDGKWIASAGADRIIRIWNAESGECAQTLIGHSAGVFDMAFSPDGKLLASAAADCTVRLWETDTGKDRHVLRGHILPVYAVAFHPDGKRLASAGGDTLIKLWDAGSGAELFALQGHEDAVGRLQFDSTGKKLASSGITRGTMIWDLESKTVVDKLKANGDVVFTPDLATGMIAYANGEVGFITVKEKEVDQGSLGLKGIHAFDLSDTARIAAISGADDTIRVVDRDTSSTLVTHRGHIGAARRVLLRLDLHKLASAGDDGAVRIWELPDPNTPKPYSRHHEHIVTSSAFSQDGELLASGDYLGSIAVWNAKTGQRKRFLGSHYIQRKLDKTPVEVGSGKPIVPGLKLKHASTYTASATLRNPIVRVLTIEGHSGGVRGIAFTPDKKVLITAGGQTLIIWDLETGKALKEFEHPTLVSSLAISRDGSLVATGCWDDIIRVFRVPSGELVKQLEGHGDDVMSVAFHPSGRELASGSRDQSVVIWDIESSKAKHRLLRHVNTVSVVQYTPDGKRLVTGGMDKSIHIWNAATGEYESTLHGHNDGVTSLALSADGGTLVSASDGTVETSARVWLWNLSRYREGALIQSEGTRGPSTLAIHPVSGNIVLGRAQLRMFDTGSYVERARMNVAAVPAETMRQRVLPESRLKVLGYALIDELPAWPNSHDERHKPRKAGNKFLVAAVSLPFERLRITNADYQRLLEKRRLDTDETEPLKFSSMLINPRQFVVSGAGQPLPAGFVGRMAASQGQGFEFMKEGVPFLENMTATPEMHSREHVYLAWEVAADFSIKGMQLRFDNDEPVMIPSLELTAFRPGKPFHPGSRSFRAGEGGDRLRSNVSRAPGS